MFALLMFFSMCLLGFSVIYLINKRCDERDQAIRNRFERLREFHRMRQSKTPDISTETKPEFQPIEFLTEGDMTI